MDIINRIKRDIIRRYGNRSTPGFDVEMADETLIQFPEGVCIKEQCNRNSENESHENKNISHH